MLKIKKGRRTYRPNTFWQHLCALPLYAAAMLSCILGALTLLIKPAFYLAALWALVTIAISLSDK